MNSDHTPVEHVNPAARQYLRAWLHYDHSVTNPATAALGLPAPTPQQLAWQEMFCSAMEYGRQARAATSATARDELMAMCEKCLQHLTDAGEQAHATEAIRIINSTAEMRHALDAIGRQSLH